MFISQPFSAWYPLKGHIYYIFNPTISIHFTIVFVSAVHSATSLLFVLVMLVKWLKGIINELPKQTIVRWMDIVRLKMWFTNVLCPPQKSQRNIFKLVLLRVIRSNTITIAPCHSETRDTKMTQPLQVFYGSLRNQ